MNREHELIYSYRDLYMSSGFIYQDCLLFKIKFHTRGRIVDICRMMSF
jgi:hypothetical protein